MDPEEVNAKIANAERVYVSRMPVIVEFIYRLRLKLDLSDFYRLAVTPELYDMLVEDIGAPIPAKQITIAGKDHLCLSECFRKTCFTPTFRRWNLFSGRTARNTDTCRDS